MMRALLLAVFILCAASVTKAQEYFYIQSFDVEVTLNEDASINVKEKISVFFTEMRHGIFRKIPFRYKIQESETEGEKIDLNAAWISKGYRHTKIENIKVKGYKYEVLKEGDYKTIKIGSQDKYVSGEQVYEISYTLLGAINFFSNFSELYLNITGNAWPVNMERVHFTIKLPKSLSDKSGWFVASGYMGSVENKTDTRWVSDTVLEGSTIESLLPYEGVTAGIRMPAGFLTKPDYRTEGMMWLLLPVFVFLGMFSLWKKWGKDLPLTVMTEFYPPDGISPSVAGYVIDGRLDKRDLTALIPYWGAAGYLHVEEIEKKKMLGLFKGTEYKFIKRKDLPSNAESFERTMFNGLFYNREEVLLSDLKDSFYQTMNSAKRELENEIKFEKYYTRYSRTLSTVLPIVGLIFLILGVINIIDNYPLNLFLWSSVIASGLIVTILGALMEKKTEKGTELYQRLLGFKEFIKSVEQDRLKEFLSQDENYFDKVLPFAIVFDVAKTWKDKLKGLDIPPPDWYSGYYAGNNFNTFMFMNNLDKGLNSMSQSFYSTPSSSGSSGGSFGGGGFSGGGFGGGGGGSW